MSNDNNPYLCGGTFFLLLTEAKGKTKTHNQLLIGPDIINNTNMLESLIRLFKPSFSKPAHGSTFKGNTSDYRSCSVSHASNLPFDDKVEIKAFDERIKNSYSSVLKEMKEFVFKYLDYESEAKTTWLTTALVETLEKDNSILNNQNLFAREDGKAVTKQELLQDAEYNLPALLLGIWHFIVKERSDNTKGRGTFESWNNPPAEKKAKWKFTSSIGKTYQRRISCKLEVADEKESLPAVTKSVSEPGKETNTLGDNFNSLINSGALEGGLFTDRLMLLDYLNNHENLYVETKVYKEALKKIQSSRILILVGSPGAGKTMTSEMIVKDYISSGHEIVCTYQSEQIPGLIEHIKQTRNQKELIYVDDCLGQAYFDLTSNQENDLKILLLLVRNYNCKTLLLNSRITIYNSVLRGETKLSKDFNFLEDKGLIHSVEKLSKLEKARIYYNHLYYNQHITNTHYKNLQPEKKYLKIINHKNYTPRLMEYVTSSLFVKNLSEECYFEKVMETLENPSKIWDDEYNKKIDIKDRLLLTTLYSLTDTTCPLELCKYAYEKRLGLEKDIDHSKNNWDATISILNGSMIKLMQSEDNRIIQIGVSDPSVNDYLSHTVFCKGSSEREILKKAAVTGNQIIRLFDNYKTVFKERTLDGSILDIEFEHYIDKCNIVTCYATENNILRPDYKNLILYSIKEKGKHSWEFYEYQNSEKYFLTILSNPKLLKYYFSKENLTDYIEYMFDRCSISILFDLLSVLNKLPIKLIKMRIEANKDKIIRLFESKIQDYVNYNIGDEISSYEEMYYGDRMHAESISDSVSDRLYENLINFKPNDDEYEPRIILDYYDEAIQYSSLCTEYDVVQYFENTAYSECIDEESNETSDEEKEVERLFEKESLR